VNSSGEAIDCFECNSDPTDYGWWDPDCDQDGYAGHRVYFPDTYNCFTDVKDDGSVDRKSARIVATDEPCMYYDAIPDVAVGYWRCFCESNLCNSDLCEDCIDPKPTPTGDSSSVSPTPTGDSSSVSPTPTGDSSSSSSSSSESSSSSPSSSATSASSTSEMPPTPDPLTGLTCYSCTDCTTVDENTETIVGEHGKVFKTCAASITKGIDGEDVVIRGGDYNAHPDGFCQHEPEMWTCFCTTDLCNNDSV
ncbi:unnamed protein product, partial [Meganyctiphanes norvegica]